MLLEEEKNRIRAEEVFRQEVRREIEAGMPERSKGNRFWSVLNSSFALWFLSSVVIAGLTAAVTTYQKSQSEHMQKADIQRHLNTEIGTRIAEGLVALRLDIKRIESGKVFFPSAVYTEAISYLDNRVTDGRKLLDFSTYPEYRLRSFRSLIFELSAVVEQSELPGLRQAEVTYGKLVALADHAALGENYSEPPDMSKSSSAVKESILILEQLQKNPFWKAQL
jgi:hypothetical protein